MDIEGKQKPGFSKNKHKHVERIPLLETNYARSCMTTPVQNEGRLVRTWGGGSKAVSTIRFSPNDGKLILSGGIDADIKLWRVDSDECVQIYKAHRESVLDMCYRFDGGEFLSSSFDKGIICWDSETGMPISTIKTEHVPFVVKFNPDKDKQNVMVAGLGDGKILRWDTRAKGDYQVFDGHVGQVNSITFVDRNRSFVSTGADKSIILWNFEGPQVVNYTKELYEIQSMSLHPISDFLAGQTLDGEILVYGQDLVQIKRKSFSGQRVYDAYCELSISPAGDYIMSGDAQGQCWFWDWQSCQVCKILKCHEGACLGAAWHPLDQNKFATCGTDGFIKLWSYEETDLLGGDENPKFLGKRKDDIDNSQEENDIENSQEENDNASSTLLMIAIATLLMTFTLNAKTYIPETNKIRLFSIAVKTVNVFCTSANLGLTALWWELIMLAYRIRPYRAVSLLGLTATWFMYWIAIERVLPHKWFVVNALVSNIFLVVLVLISIVRICSSKCNP